MSQILSGIPGRNGNSVVSRQYVVPRGTEKMNVPSKVLIILGWHGDTHSHSFMCLFFVGQYALVQKGYSAFPEF